jgi:hypothetical protein
MRRVLRRGTLELGRDARDHGGPVARAGLTE